MKKQFEASRWLNKPNLPWETYGDYGYDDGAVDSKGNIIFTDAITEDDAKFIVKAVNYHDRLVEALLISIQNLDQYYHKEHPVARELMDLYIEIKES